MQFLSSNFIVLFSEQLKNGMLPTPTFWNDMTRGDQLKQKAWVAQSMNDWTHIRTIMENLHHTWHLSDGRERKLVTFSNWGTQGAEEYEVEEGGEDNFVIC